MLIRVSGNIISELSEKIPSNTIALNELIKNSYDAGASKVLVQIKSEKRKLIIVDDGSGMDLNDIRKLFHISKSDKQYGRINEYGRYTQGSKGLGFLSVFKFGSRVVWKTKKSGSQGFQFIVNFDDLIKSDNITDFEVNVEKCDDIEKGTLIEIELSSNSIDYFLRRFNDEVNYLKIVNSFIDDSFLIELDIDGRLYSTKDLPHIKEILPEHQLFFVNYSSSDEKIKFYYNNELIEVCDFDFNSEKYSLELEIIIYHLVPYAKEKISRLFFNARNELTPLIYINLNLFNNYELFDPNITRSTKHEQSLPQMIGYIKIFSDHEQMVFNSDRSHFLQNELTDSIKEFLEKINIEIQKRGSEFKKYLVNLNFLKTMEFYSDKVSDEEIKNNIVDDFRYKDKVTFVREGHKILYYIFGKKIETVINVNKKQDVSKNLIAKKRIEKQKLVPAKIELKNEKKKMYVPSPQINLYEEINSATDSTGKKINLREIAIEVDGVLMESGILPSILEPCIKKVVYSYKDGLTDLVTASMLFQFEVKEIELFANNNERKSLFSLPLKKNYSISFSDVVNRIKSQIDSLSIDDYKELIACSLRCIFELSIDSIEKCGKFGRLNLRSKKHLEDKVEEIIQYIVANPRIITEIDNNTLLGYSNLSKILDVEDFKKAVLKSHMGAHKSYALITIKDIEYISKMAAFFMVFINEMVSNPKIV